ncbi:MAG: PhzF family phenazine biosynthesis protein [Deltaproteobacteria bacterium]|nr:PhzF family phenazine biosynthesis protein [Deltaproteobacteria bacterium]
MTIPLYQVDAFTGTLFAGNPAAVVFPSAELSAATMQAIAAENNLAETAFVLPAEDGFRIRWFTPSVEVDLCGHATLASAHVLFSHRGFPWETISFSSKSGTLQVRKDGELLVLDFPADTLCAVEIPPGLSAGLGVEPREIYRGKDDYLAVLGDEKEIAGLAPNTARLSAVHCRGVIVTAPGSGVDFVSRFFAPRIGINEDPVTGSAHTALVPYWAKRLGKTRLRARQLSPRGGELNCRDCGARVEIAGRAVTYLIGEIVL